ncbi:MAG: hypothetical protein AB7O44_19960 [Hyphomicrobiaceae bacterium]
MQPLRTLALDSSHLSTWCDDCLSGNGTRNGIARNFERALAEHGMVPLLCLHHIEELLAVDDVRRAAERVQFLASRPAVAWIASVHDAASIPGSVVDILSHEVRTAFSNPCLDAARVRDAVRPRLVRYGTGEQFAALFTGRWQWLRLEARARAERSRHIVAVSRSTSWDISSMTIEELANKPLRTAQEAVVRFSRMRQSLSNEIRERGDKRIANPETVSAEFIEEVVRTTGPLPLTARDLIHRSLLPYDISPCELTPGMTVGELGELMIFRKRLRMASDAVRVPWDEAKARITKRQLPAMIIDRALRLYGQDQPERKGSEMTDRDLATLSPYADIITVDRRTKEDFRRALSRAPDIRLLVRQVEKASRYPDIARTF